MQDLQVGVNAGALIAGRFALTAAQLGEGGYGSVYLAQDTSTTPPARVAAKVISLQTCTEAQAKREVDAYRRVQGHAGPRCAFVLSMHAEALVHGVAHYLFLEYCERGDLLDHVLSSGGTGEVEGRSLFAEMLGAAHHLHACGVAHRDIKLENFFLTQDGPSASVRLGDLGLAALAPPGATDPPLCEQFAGSPAYAAPEVFATEESPAGPPYAPAIADAWSLGVCLFTMLANMMPVDEATEDDWRFRLLKQCEQTGGSFVEQFHSEAHRPCTLSAQAKDLLARMLAVRPRDRLTAREALGHAWLTGAAEPAPPEPPGWTPEALARQGYGTSDAYASEVEEDAVFRSEVDARAGCSGGEEEPPLVWRTCSSRPFFAEGAGGPAAMAEDFLPKRQRAREAARR